MIEQEIKRSELVQETQPEKTAIAMDIACDFIGFANQTWGCQRSSFGEEQTLANGEET